MNRFFLSFLVIGLILFSSSCKDEDPPVPTEDPSNETEFDDITVSGKIDLNITQGSEYSVTVRGDASISDGVTADYTGGALDLSLVATIPEAIIDIVMPHIRTLESTGSGTVSISNFTGLTILDIKSEGSGLVTITNSRVEFASLTTRRAGEIDAFGLMATAVGCDLFGVRDISVTVDSQLNGSIIGNGNINYKGFPTDIVVDISGEGQVLDAN